jgi:hypothetical protein
MPTMEPEEGGDATFASKLWHVEVQVHPIDTFEFEDHMFADEEATLGRNFMAGSG